MYENNDSNVLKNLTNIGVYQTTLCRQYTCIGIQK